MKSAIRKVCFYLVWGILFSAPVKAQKSEKFIDLSGKGWVLWLDKQASFIDDSLYLQSTVLDQMLPNEPTIGWDQLFQEPVSWQSVQRSEFHKNETIPAIRVQVPGTVEEYLWNANKGDYTGVSWWGKTIDIPKEFQGKSVKLHFRQGARMRCEVYVNQQLVHYNLVSMLPFEADISSAVKFGDKNQIAIRITDALGNFGWADIRPMKWGKHVIPPSHGFGGIMGAVELEFHENLHIEDIFLMNKPEITGVDAIFEINNGSKSAQSTIVEVNVVEAKNPDKVVFSERFKENLSIGSNRLSYAISVPEARIWSLDSPELYFIKVNLLNKKGKLQDYSSERFGFRWFEVAGQGEDAMFMLNGKRIVLRTAISWGYYPVNGMYATPELARKHVQAAKDIGLNMLSFHRGMGQEIVLDMADELGILFYAEPGGYTSGNKQKHGATEFTREWVSEKWLRMVKAMRNHPSLVMYNMINEQADDPDDRNHEDMRLAHELDVSRVKTYVSGWVEEGTTELKKLHMLPYDTTQYHYGWFDFHHARGWGSLQSLHYRNPSTFFLNSSDKQEIVFYGEEGAIAVPPLLESAMNHYIQTGKDGWDGAAYRSWLTAYNQFLDKKGWRRYYPTVDGLINQMGELSHYYQGRIIENVRISNTIDGYAVNGYECERNENHSGVVDVFRNPKTDPDLMAYYNQPLYVALKARQKIQHVNSKDLLDAFIVNEVDLKGIFQLIIKGVSPEGIVFEIANEQVVISGGNIYGELLAEGIEVPFSLGDGRYQVNATLIDKFGKTKALGKEDYFVVDNLHTDLPKGGALIDVSGVSKQFLNKLPAYAESMSRLNYIVLTQGDDEFSEIPAHTLQTVNEKPGGVTLEVFSDERLTNLVKTVQVPRIRYDELSYPFEENLNLKPELSYRFSGYIVPEVTGDYELEISHNWVSRLFINNEKLMEGKNSVAGGVDGAKPVKYFFEKGKKYKVQFESTKPFGRPLTHSALRWKLPESAYCVDELLKRVEEDGTTLIVAHSAEEFLKALDQKGAVSYQGNLTHGHSWKGGIYFNVPHPIFNKLPKAGPFNWEYQLFTRYFGPRHRSFILDGEEPIVASISDHQHQVGTAMGVVNYGKGKVLFSVFDIAPHLNSTESPALMAKKLLLNMINFSTQETEN